MYFLILFTKNCNSVRSWPNAPSELVSCWLVWRHLLAGFTDFAQPVLEAQNVKETTTEVGNALLLQVHWSPCRWERDHRRELVPVVWCQLFPPGRLVWRSIEIGDLAPLLHISSLLSPVKYDILTWNKIILSCHYRVVGDTNTFN
jgi:hypothetical protein